MRQTPQIERLAYRVAEFAEAIGVSRSKVYELINEGRVPSIRIGNSVRVPVDAARKFLEELAVAGTSGR